MNHWLAYIVARLGIFIIALAVLVLLGVDWGWSAVFATLIALALSLLLLGSFRQRAADDLQRRTEKPEPDNDSVTEDEQLDR
jgi:membrane protein implicated in regulation of membrane protease activity